MTMRSLAAAMTMPPDADSMHEDVELGPVEVLPAQVAVGEQGGEDHGDGDARRRRRR